MNFHNFARDYFAGKKIKNIKLSGGNIYLYREYCQNLFEFGYVGTVLVAELNICTYKKVLELHHLLFSKDHIAYFADQLL